MIYYLGKLDSKCDMCSKYGTHMYKDDKSLMKAMFKEVEWEEQIICLLAGSCRIKTPNITKRTVRQSLVTT
jgi:hypothetical protein